MFKENNLLAGDPDGLPAKAVQITVPAKVAFDLGSMQKVTASILDRFGCPNCHSGLDIRFDIENRFMVDEKLNIRSFREL